MKRAPGIPKSKRGMVDPRDIYLTGALADKCGVNIAVVCQAATELGPEKATEEAVCRRALELRDKKRWR
jgi:hypothetical protein